MSTRLDILKYYMIIREHLLYPEKFKCKKKKIITHKSSKSRKLFFWGGWEIGLSLIYVHIYF